VVRDDQPDAREGQAGRRGESERFIVPMKPGNSGAHRAAGRFDVQGIALDLVDGAGYRLDPILAEAIQDGFEDAVNKIRKTATKSRTRQSSHQVVEALAAVETLRAVLSNTASRSL
jgi:hypothetical protein